MNELFSHEDDYCQIELLPTSNEAFCKRQTESIDAFSEKHRDGVGFTDILVREENPHSLTDLSISRDELINAIGSSAECTENVVTGYASHREQYENTIAFSPTQNVVLFAEFNEANVVETAWLKLDIFTETDVISATLMNSKLTQWQLLLVDWGWSQYFNIADSESVERYLKKRLEVFSEIEREYQRQKDG